MAKCHLSHGHTVGNKMSRTYNSWVSMRRRCRDPNHHHFHLYGGRGIKVCPEWESFEVFLRDMGERPAGTTIDRQDTEGGYSAANCRWATPKQQINNTRVNVSITIDGVTQSLMMWVDHFEGAVPYQSVWQRLKRGWEPIRALTEPVDERRRRKTATA